MGLGSALESEEKAFSKPLFENSTVFEARASMIIYRPQRKKLGERR